MRQLKGHCYSGLIYLLSKLQRQGRWFRHKQFHYHSFVYSVFAFWNHKLSIQHATCTRHKTKYFHLKFQFFLNKFLFQIILKIYKIVSKILPQYTIEKSHKQTLQSEIKTPPKCKIHVTLWDLNKHRTWEKITTSVHNIDMI